MKKYLVLLKYEMKTILKDPMNIFMVFFPLIMLAICAFLLPAILNATTSPDSAASAYTLLIGFTVILAMGGYISGAMLGFSLLDNKDENTLLNIAVTPITISGYATFKIVYSYVISVISNIVMLFGLKILASDAYVITLMGHEIRLLDTISYGEGLAFSVVASLLVPAIAMIIVSVAKNKIEGFAVMKGGGLFIMIPMLALIQFFQDGKQYLLGILPNFWTFKAILNESMGYGTSANLPFWAYLLIGGVYTTALAYLSLRMFLKKVNMK